MGSDKQIILARRSRMKAVTNGTRIHSVLTLDSMRASTGPFWSRAAIRSPSPFLMPSAGIDGRRFADSGVGVPQTLVPIIS